MGIKLFHVTEIHDSEGLIHTRHFDGQYCDKKIFLSHDFYGRYTQV